MASAGEREIVPASAMMGIFGAAAQSDLALSAISGGLTHAITHASIMTMIFITVRATMMMMMKMMMITVNAQ